MPIVVDHRWRRLTLVGAMALLSAYAAIAYHLRRQIADGYSDFISFYTAGKILELDAGHRLYDLALEYQIQHEYAPRVAIRAGALPFVRLPFAAWPFVPLAHLPYAAAFLVWDLATIILVIIIAALFRKHIAGLERVKLRLIILLLFSYFPVFVTLIQGQDALWLLLVFAVTYVLLVRRREEAAGMILGLGWFKFPLLIPFLVPFLAARRFRLLAGFGLTSTLLAAASFWTTGWPALAAYPRYLMAVNQLSRGVNDPRDMPNLRGLVQVILDKHLSVVMINLIVGALSLCLLAWLAMKARCFARAADNAVFSLAFSLDLVITVLVSYHAHVFDLVLLALFLAIGWGILSSDAPLRPTIRNTLAIALACLIFSPLYLLLALASRYTMLLSLVLLGAALVISRTMSDLETHDRSNQHGACGRGFEVGI